MLPPFPLVPCGVPRGYSEWLRPDVIAPVSSDAVRLVGTAMKDKWGDSPEREQASLRYLRGA